MSISLSDLKLSVPATPSICSLVLATVMMLLAALPVGAQTYTVLYSFDGGARGGSPLAPLLRNSQGDLLGTTSGGGAGGFGLFFKLSGDKETILHSFERADGESPMGSVVRDAAGNFYGTTLGGGASLAGSIYKMDKGGVVTTLYSFHEYPGQNPEGGVIIDSTNNLYGTTATGGGPCGCGVVFELSNTNTYVVLHRFAGGADGQLPASGLLRDSLGNLYGTTVNGGSEACSDGCGTVFKVTVKGVEKIMHRFAGPPGDGANPYAGLVRDHAGNFYGTTSAGGTANQGTVFKIDTAGTETVLYSFQGGNDGAQPMAPLVLDSQGDLYGTTYAGGGGDVLVCSSGCGTVFKLDESGGETILHVFSDLTDGFRPEAGLILDPVSNLYGTTDQGGSTGNGAVFQITP
jgi:uncharacterized repeat protein (TIGR03803 family)